MLCSLILPFRFRWGHDSSNEFYHLNKSPQVPCFSYLIKWLLGTSYYKIRSTHLSDIHKIFLNTSILSTLQTSLMLIFLEFAYRVLNLPSKHKTRKLCNRTSWLTQCICNSENNSWSQKREARETFSFDDKVNSTKVGK